MCDVRKFGDHDLATDFSEPRYRFDQVMTFAEWLFCVDDFGDTPTNICDLFFSIFDPPFERALHGGVAG